MNRSLYTLLVLLLCASNSLASYEHFQCLVNTVNTHAKNQSTALRQLNKSANALRNLFDQGRNLETPSYPFIDAEGNIFKIEVEVNVQLVTAIEDPIDMVVADFGLISWDHQGTPPTPLDRLLAQTPPKVIEIASELPQEEVVDFRVLFSYRSSNSLPRESQLSFRELFSFRRSNSLPRESQLGFFRRLNVNASTTQEAKQIFSAFSSNALSKSETLKAQNLLADNKKITVEPLKQAKAVVKNAHLQVKAMHSTSMNTQNGSMSSQNGSMSAQNGSNNMLMPGNAPSLEGLHQAPASAPQKSSPSSNQDLSIGGLNNHGISSNEHNNHQHEDVVPRLVIKPSDYRLYITALSKFTTLSPQFQLELEQCSFPNLGAALQKCNKENQDNCESFGLGHARVKCPPGQNYFGANFCVKSCPTDYTYVEGGFCKSNKTTQMRAFSNLKQAKRVYKVGSIFSQGNIHTGKCPQGKVQDLNICYVCSEHMVYMGKGLCSWNSANRTITPMPIPYFYQFISLEADKRAESATPSSSFHF